MILNELLTKQNVISKLLLKNGEKELSKELKVKIIRIRAKYNKIKKELNKEVEMFLSELRSEEFELLHNNPNRSEEENRNYSIFINNITECFNEYLHQKGIEEVADVDDSFTIDEYADILDVNIDNSVEINNAIVSAEDFMEIVYELFVKEY
jgi:molecular chaperone GrpE (heat shock protein)